MNSQDNHNSPELSFRNPTIPSIKSSGWSYYYSIWTNVSRDLKGMWLGGGALDITHIVPSGCTKGSSVRVWLTQYTYGMDIVEPSFMEINRVVWIVGERCVYSPHIVFLWISSKSTLCTQKLICIHLWCKNCHPIKCGPNLLCFHPYVFILIFSYFKIKMSWSKHMS